MKRLLRKATNSNNQRKKFDKYLQYLDGLPNIVPLNVHYSPRLDEHPALNVLVPGLALGSMSGGPNTLLNLAFRLASEQIHIRFISTDIPKESDDNKIRAHLQSLTGLAHSSKDSIEFLDGSNRKVPIKIGRNDYFFASAWWNVQMIKYAQRDIANKERKFFYLIQEFEPSLYSWSSRYALALETYSLPHWGIFCGDLIKDYFFKNEIGIYNQDKSKENFSSFNPAIDRNLFRSQKSPSKKTFVFYARPTIADRNMFELGLYALRTAAMRGAFSKFEWDLFFIGEEVPQVELAPGVTIKPVGWLNYQGYADLISRTDLGLSLMLSPHTSYPPLEIAAAGGRCITNTFANKTAHELSRLSNNIIGVEPPLEKITNAIIEAASIATAESEFLKSNEIPSTWAEALAEPKGFMLNKMKC